MTYPPTANAYPRRRCLHHTARLVASHHVSQPLAKKPHHWCQTHHRHRDQPTHSHHPQVEEGIIKKKQVKRRKPKFKRKMEKRKRSSSPLGVLRRAFFCSFLFFLCLLGALGACGIFFSPFTPAFSFFFFGGRGGRSRWHSGIFLRQTLYTVGGVDEIRLRGWWGGVDFGRDFSVLGVFYYRSLVG